MDITKMPGHTCPFYVGTRCYQDEKYGWISVEDGLPKPLEHVIVICTNPWSMGDQPHVSTAMYWGNLPWAKSHPTWSKHKNVTHWMYPPKIPDGLVKER